MKLAYTLFALLIPTLEAATIFPICKEEAVANCMFNRSYACHLQQVAELYPSNEAVRVTIQENNRLYKAWDYLRDAKTESYSEELRRIALFKLRGTIGVEAFDRGEMPDAVPLWRFAYAR